jgi:hypothetical protein
VSHLIAQVSFSICAQYQPEAKETNMLAGVAAELFKAVIGLRERTRGSQRWVWVACIESGNG